MRVRSLVATAVAVALLLPCLVEAQSTQRSKKRRGKKAAAAAAAAAWLLPDTQPSPSAKELAGQFPGADAVVVLDAIQHEWVDDHQLTRVLRRVRLLTDKGAEEQARIEIFLPETSGPWIAWDGNTRLIDAAGSATALPGLTTEAVDGGMRISVEAGGASAGDLLELSQELESKRPSYPPWTAQGRLPVLESRIVVIPPPIVTVRAYGFGLPAGDLEPTDFEHGDLTAAGWRFSKLAALPDSPLAAPLEAVAGRLLLAIEKYPNLETGETLDLDWPAWGRMAEAVTTAWTGSSLAKSLAEGLGEAATPESVVSALREKLSVARTAPWPEHDSGKAAIDAGSGNSADFALLAAAVLEAAGFEDVALVATRAAARGQVAAKAPMEGNFSELLVRVGQLWLDPAPGGGLGALPHRFAGTLHAPLGPSLAEPVTFPAVSSADNRLERKAHLTLAADGRLSGSSTWTWSPLAASLAGSTTTSLERPVDRPGWGEREGSAMDYGVLPWRLFQDLDLSDGPPAGVIDLGLPRLVIDEIAVDLPDGVTGAKLASPAKIDAGPAGSYERTLKPEGRTVTVTRTFRLDVTRFPPEEAEALFNWLRRIQEAERAVTKLQLK